VLINPSTLVFYAEREVPGTKFTNIPQAMWWGITTMTTVGYGDLSPETVLGRVIASFTALCGLALFAMLMQVVGKALTRGLFGAVEEDIAADENEDETFNEQALLPCVPERMADHVLLRDQGLVSDEEFEATRKRLIGQI